MVGFSPALQQPRTRGSASGCATTDTSPLVAEQQQGQLLFSGWDLSFVLSNWTLSSGLSGLSFGGVLGALCKDSPCRRCSSAIAAGTEATEGAGQAGGKAAAHSSAHQA